VSGKLSPVGSFAWFASKSGLGFPDHGAGWPAMCCRLTANKFKVDVSGAPRTRRRPFTIVVKLSARCLMRLRLSSVRATRSPSARRLFRPMHMQRSVEDLTSPAARTRVWMEDVYVVGFLKALIGAYHGSPCQEPRRRIPAPHLRFGGCAEGSNRDGILECRLKKSHITSVALIFCEVSPASNSNFSGG
jgi:hypothetical protein